MDEDGIVGYPWLTTIDCPYDNNDELRMEGVLTHGHVRFYYRDGDL